MRGSGGGALSSERAPSPGRFFFLLLCPLLFAAGGCSPRIWLMRPKVKKVRPRVSRIGWSGVDLEFRLHVWNPNFLKLRTPRFVGGLDIEDIGFLTADVPVSYDLAARKTSTITVPAHISYAGLWKTYKKLRKASEGHYRLRGKLLFSVLGRQLSVPVWHRGKFPILRMPKFTALRMGFSRLSLTRLKVTVEVEVVNPNVFGVDIKDLGYALQLGDTRIGGLTASTDGTIGPGKAGRVTLTGQMSATRAALGLMRGASIRDARLVPTGFLQTDYGKVKLEKYAKPIGGRPEGSR